MAASLYNIVGFQTNLAYPEQDRIFHMIPGLVKHCDHSIWPNASEYLYLFRQKYYYPPCKQGRGEFIICRTDCRRRRLPGQLRDRTCRRYLIIARLLKNQPVLTYPECTMLGALCNYISSAAADHFQPIKANFGLLPELPNKINSKKDRSYQKYSRAISEMQQFIHGNNL